AEARYCRRRTLRGPDDRWYRWDMHRRVVVLSLDDPHHRGVALYCRTTSRYFDIFRVKCTTGDIARIEHMLDSIILTIIYVEKLRMDEELK
ncbi:hypothetical protein SCLCIDRAFT_49251, partial [Scleroderma citrinum Foug A]